jgi:hypothetical protein
MPTTTINRLSIERPKFTWLPPKAFKIVVPRADYINTSEELLPLSRERDCRTSSSLSVTVRDTRQNPSEHW